MDKYLAYVLIAGAVGGSVAISIHSMAKGNVTDPIVACYDAAAGEDDRTKCGDLLLQIKKMEHDNAQSK